MRLALSVAVVAVLASPVMAQQPVPPNTIIVAATGTVETPPNMATISLTMRGEGKTPDAATIAVAAKQKAVFGGLQKLDPKMVVQTGGVSMREKRVGNCTNAPYDSGDLATMADNMEAMADDLDTTAAGAPIKGPCKVVGYTASSTVEVVLAAAKDAGTAIGLAGRLGASSADLQAFGLRDPASANKRAATEAIARARADATAIAAATGATLGPVVSVATGERNRPYIGHLGIAETSLNAMPMAMAPPIVLDVAPKPVETVVQLMVTFSIVR